jgi:hypothetical protein
MAKRNPHAGTKSGGKKHGAAKRAGNASTRKSGSSNGGPGQSRALKMASPVTGAAAPPPPFIYFVSAQNFGAFVWDGSNGGALYVGNRSTVCRALNYWQTVVANGFTYYYFAEPKQNAGAKTRIWQFEAPSQGKSFCLVTYYYSGTSDPPTAFGDAVYRTVPG